MVDQNNGDFLGQGWSFPVREEEQKVPTSKETRSIKESIGIILSTRRGERVMRPDFGCDVHELTFEPTQDFSMVEFYVKEALDAFEPRIAVESVTSEQDPEEEGRMLITIEYHILSLNRPDNMVFPFYLEGSR